MIKFQQSQALTSHFESFWSIVPCLTFWSKVRLGNMAENELILCKIRKVRFLVAFSAIFINIFTFWYRANWQWEMFALLHLSFYLIYFSWGLIIALLSGNLLEEVSVTYWKYERWHWKSNQAGVQHLLLRLNKNMRSILTWNDYLTKYALFWTFFPWN